MQIDLTWPICVDGYEIGLLNPDRDLEVIQPKSGRMRLHKPLENHSALLKQLSGISTRRGFLQFANFNGLLSHPTHPECLDEWRESAYLMHKTVNQSCNNTFSYLLEYFNKSKDNVYNIKLTCDTSHPRLVTKLSTLKQALWWQFLSSLILNQSFEHCALCFSWFTVGAGTGRRKRSDNINQSFCCPQHQGRFKYNQKKRKLHEQPLRYKEKNQT